MLAKSNSSKEVTPGCKNDTTESAGATSDHKICDSGLQISTGTNNTCAVNSQNKLYCWGENIYGKLGDCTTINRTTPKQIGNRYWRTISTADTLTCGITCDQSVWCWGGNKQGQLGDETTKERLLPFQIKGL